MTSVTALLRPEIRDMTPYRSARFIDGLVRLNANENPWRPAGDDTAAGLNRYPEPRPGELAARLARHYGVAEDGILVTRGSSEAIDVVIRAFCRAGQDEIVICPPTFGMYETYAQIQGARIRRIPLLKAQGYALDVDAILDQWNPQSRLLFVCTPNNPTGNSVPLADIQHLARTLEGRGVVVVDAAYVEFAAADPTATLLQLDNVIVLRTLSKARALAGVRCGALLARPEVVSALGCVLPPYTFPTLCSEAVERSLDAAGADDWMDHIEQLKAERARLSTGLAALSTIRRVWPSEGNFLLVESDDAPGLVKTALAGGFLLRDFSWDPALPGSIRISVGTPTENTRLLEVLAKP